METNTRNVTVKINRLGRIRNSQLEVLPFVFFSGESGLGKSYMALLCHYFAGTLLTTSRLTRFFKEKAYDYTTLAKKFEDKGTALEITKAELEGWLAKDSISFMGMMLGHDALSGEIEVKLPNVIPDKLTFHYEKRLTGIVGAEENDVFLNLEGLNYRVTSAFLEKESPFSSLLRAALSIYFFSEMFKVKRSYVFPPSRGVVLTERVLADTGMYGWLLQNLSELNRAENASTTQSQLLLNLLHQILDGDIKREDNKYFYQMDGMESPIPISAAAASVREIAPLELLARKGDVTHSSVLFEEPEAHLHPLKQRMMADILSAFANVGCFLQVTTHSDYLIRRLNELIRLHEVKERLKNDERRLNKLCQEIHTSPMLSLDSNNIAAYLLVSNGDGTSRIERQVVNDGVPYEAFSEAIDRSMETELRLEEELDNASE